MFRIKQLSFYALLSLGITFTALATVVAQTVVKGIKNVVLVHGAVGNGSSWSKTVAQLQAKDYKVIAVQNPLTSFSEDVDATKRAIEKTKAPATPSYRAILISDAKNDPNVAGLLYVVASIPEEAQNASTAMPLTGVGPEFQPSPDDCLSLSLQGHQ